MNIVLQIRKDEHYINSHLKVHDIALPIVPAERSYFLIYIYTQLHQMQNINDLDLFAPDLPSPRAPRSICYRADL